MKAVTFRTLLHVAFMILLVLWLLAGWARKVGIW